MKNKMAGFLALSMMAFLGSALSARGGAQESCSVRDLKRFYGHDLDKEYKARGEANNIAQMLYRGPLMREGDSSGLGSLRGLFVRGRDVDIQYVQGIVREHLYGDSEEFRKLLAKLAEEHDEREAAARVRDSVYRAFGYRAKSPSTESLDQCLIATRQAHLVVTRVLVDYMDRKKLD